VKTADREALAASYFADRPQPAPTGALLAFASGRRPRAHDRVRVPKPVKLPKAWVEVDKEVADAIAIIKAARVAQHPGLHPQFLTRASLIREALLSVAEQLTTD